MIAANSNTRPLPDLQFSNIGFAASCVPMSEAGENWLAGHVADASRPLLIEFRYLEDIVLGARADGLICEG